MITKILSPQDLKMDLKIDEPVTNEAPSEGSLLGCDNSMVPPIMSPDAKGGIGWKSGLISAEGNREGDRYVENLHERVNLSLMLLFLSLGYHSHHSFISSRVD